jgi:diguanylate cyclase (GGDEF)-like protein
MRALGTLAVCGGGLAAVTVALPPAAGESELAVILAGVASAIAGIAMLLARRPWGEVTIGLTFALGTVLITVATWSGGFESTGTADNEILYVWIVLFAFYFLSFRHALAQFAFVGLAYAWFLSTEGLPFDELATRMIVTLSTLLLTGILISRLGNSLNRLVDELSDHARLDHLTGLLNRRALEERAVVEFARAKRESAYVAMLILDLDGFKRVNDTHGHPVGDEVLCRVARALEFGTRRSDAVARIGGDEFAVLLPGADGAEAREIAERLRDEIVDRADDAAARMTISIGVAAGPAADHSLEQLWHAADAAMYSAKRLGGDGVATVAAESRALTLPLAG